MNDDFKFQFSGHSQIDRIANACLIDAAKERAISQGYASLFYEQIVEEINAFDSSLDNAHEVGMKLASFGEVITFRVDDVGFQDPYLIYFYGCLEDGSPVQLVQNVSQISFVMIKMKRSDPEKPKHPIGFRCDAD